MLRVRLISDDGHEDVRRSEALSVSIGRSSDNDIRVDQPTVSSHHLRILHGLVIADCGSLNGTFVDGQRIKGACLVPSGTEIELGGTSTRLVVEDLAEDELEGGTAARGAARLGAEPHPGADPVRRPPGLERAARLGIAAYAFERAYAPERAPDATLADESAEGEEVLEPRAGSHDALARARAKIEELRAELRQCQRERRDLEREVARLRAASTATPAADDRRADDAPGAAPETWRVAAAGAVEAASGRGATTTPEGASTTRQGARPTVALGGHEGPHLAGGDAQVRPAGILALWRAFATQEVENREPLLEAPPIEFLTLELLRLARKLERVGGRVAPRSTGGLNGDTLPSPGSDDLRRLAARVLSGERDTEARRALVDHVRRLTRSLLVSGAAQRKAAEDLVDELRERLSEPSLVARAPLSARARLVGRETELWRRAARVLDEFTPAYLEDRLDVLARDAASRLLQGA